jgi:hypothetical protein
LLGTAGAINPESAIDLPDRLRKAQNEFYPGSSGAALERFLAPNITWTLPGDISSPGPT